MTGGTNAGATDTGRTTESIHVFEDEEVAALQRGERVTKSWDRPLADSNRPIERGDRVRVQCRGRTGHSDFSERGKIDVYARWVESERVQRGKGGKRAHMTYSYVFEKAADGETPPLRRWDVRAKPGGGVLVEIWASSAEDAVCVGYYPVIRRYKDAGRGGEAPRDLVAVACDGGWGGPAKEIP